MVIAKAFLLSTFFIIANVVSAQQNSVSRLWNSLDPGSYAVGFKVINAYDQSRTWARESGSTSRPVRISLWYPAIRRKSAVFMAYRSYVHFNVKDAVFIKLNSDLESRNVGSLKQVLKGDKAFTELMAEQTAAISKAPMASGRFPLVVYSAGLNETGQHANNVLCEYLASHGFIVATVPQVGTSNLRLNLGINPIDLETQVRDLEFALGVVRKLPNSNSERVAAMGHSMGGIVALLLQLRNQGVDAVVGLDASYGNGGRLAEALTKSPYYIPERMNVPLMDLRRPNDRLDLASVNVFRYSDRYYLEFPGLFHGDFTSFPMIASNFPTDIQGRTAAIASRGYELVCRYVLNFLKASLKQDAKARAQLTVNSSEHKLGADVVNLTMLKGMQTPPIEEEFVQIIVAEGLIRAIDTYRRFKKLEPEQPIIREAYMTSLGYDFLSPNPRVSLAIDIFRLIIEAHPTSADAHDSLAEAYLVSGNKPMAITYYERVLAVLPSDKGIGEEAKTRLRTNAIEKLIELKR